MRSEQQVPPPGDGTSQAAPGTGDEAGRDTVLVLADALMGAEQMAAGVRQRLGGRYRVATATWDLDLEATVAANLRVERQGPEAVSATWSSPVPAGDVVAVLTQFTPLSEATLAQWPRLRAVATLRAGTENVDVAAVQRRGLAFSANAGRNANAVAEMAVALMLAVLRDVGENHHAVRTGGWRPPVPAAGRRELSGRRLGLVGYGAVGRTVAHRLSGFDMDVAYYDPWLPPPALPGASDATAPGPAGPHMAPHDPVSRSMSLPELLARSDVLSLHARHTPGQPPLIGAAELDLLPPGAVLINTARAELLDEAALLERLADGRLGGCGLDVFSTEPLPPQHPLRRASAVVLSPHLAGSTQEARQQAPHLIAARLAELLHTGG